MGVYVDTSQLDALAVQLAAVDVSEESRREVAKSGHRAQAGAQVLSPVDTGFLKSSIGVDIDGLSYTVGADAHYAGYVEYGTSKMSPQPYMNPAFDAELVAFVRAVGAIAEHAL